MGPVEDVRRTGERTIETTLLSCNTTVMLVRRYDMTLVPSSSILPYMLLKEVSRLSLLAPNEFPSGNDTTLRSA